MSTITINIDNKETYNFNVSKPIATKILNYIDTVSHPRTKTEKKLSLLQEIEGALIEVKLMQEGKLPKKYLKDLLNEK